MMRRYPVRSVLSERKMFSNGGMLPTSKPIESSMDRASGIMASSSPLIDAVSQEILAPMTGGAMPMAQGGIARFKNGGTARKSFNFNPSTFEITPIEEFAPRAGERTIIGQDASTEDLIRRAMFRKPDYGDLTEGLNLGLGGDSRNKAMADSTRFTPDGSIAASESFKEGFDLMTKGRGTGELVNEMFPYEASLEGGSSGGQQLRPGFFGLEQEKGPSRPIVDALRAPLQILDQAARGLSQVNKGLANYLFNFGEYALSVKPQGTGHINFLGQIAAVNDALRRAPQIRGVSTEELGKEINQFAKIAIAEAPDMSGNELSKAIAEDIYDKYEAGLGMAASDTLQDPSGDREPTPYLGEEPIGQDIGVGNKFTIEGISTDEDMADIPTDSDAAAAPDPAADPTAAAAADPTAAADPDTVVSGGDVYNKLMMESDADGGDVRTKRQARTDAALANLVKATAQPDMSEKEATKTIAAYKQEFMAEMPEYEGMSEAEKGFALMEAGLRVAAGESPNAITNVAKGLKGLGATFAKDDKEKRAWEQTVNLSAAKYALQNVKTDRTRAEALAKERRGRVEYVALKAGTDPVTGRKFAKGDVLPFTTGQIHDGILENFGSGTIGLPETFKAIQAGISTANKHLLDGRIKYSDFRKDRELYGKESKNLISGLQMRLLMGDAAQIIKENPNNVLGAVGFIKKATDSVLNTFGLRTEKERSEYLKGIGRGKKFDALMSQISTKMITQILNEGNRTVSDADRKRVDELVGSYSDYLSNVDGSLGALRIKMEGLSNSIDQGILSSQAELDIIDNQYNNALERDRYELLQRYKRVRFGKDKAVQYGGSDLQTKTGFGLQRGNDGIYRRINIGS